MLFIAQHCLSNVLGLRLKDENGDTVGSFFFVTRQLAHFIFYGKSVRMVVSFCYAAACAFHLFAEKA
jgi:hypothetical protein